MYIFGKSRPFKVFTMHYPITAGCVLPFLGIGCVMVSSFVQVTVVCQRPCRFPSFKRGTLREYMRGLQRCKRT